jgi:hypothetical protein
MYISLKTFLIATALVFIPCTTILAERLSGDEKINRRIETSIKQTGEYLEKSVRHNEYAIKKGKENIIAVDQLIKDAQEHAIILSNGSKVFLSLDGQYVIDENGNSIYNSAAIEEALRIYKSSPESYIEC